MKVCVVIPTYNRAPILARAISSVLAQTYEDLELWIIDDGSTDRTLQVVRAFSDSRIRYVFQENRGVSAARNLAINKTDAPFTAFLDSDDEWLPTKLYKQIEFMRTRSCSISHTDEIWIRNGKRVNQMKKHRKPSGRIFTSCLPLCSVSPSTFIAKTSILKENQFDETYPVCEDYDLWLRLSAQFEFGLVSEPLVVKYGGHEDQLSRKFHSMDQFRIQSLWNLRKSKLLDSYERFELYSELIKKCEIFRAGLIKHNHPSHEIDHVLEEAKQEMSLLEPQPEFIEEPFASDLCTSLR